MSLEIGSHQCIHTNNQKKSSTTKKVLTGIAAGAIGLALLTRGKNPAKIITKVTGGKPPKLPPLVNQILRPVKERFFMALDCFKSRNPNDFISKSEFMKELEKLIQKAYKKGKIKVGPKIRITPQSNVTVDDIRWIQQTERDLNTAREAIRIMV